MRRLFRLLLLLVVIFLIYIGWTYYGWATNSAGADNPFDEAGIEIHAYMPKFVQDWGCGELKAEFGSKTLPPYGCQSPTDPTIWR
jgi:hypothetical protein